MRSPLIGAAAEGAIAANDWLLADRETLLDWQSHTAAYLIIWLYNIEPRRPTVCLFTARGQNPTPPLLRLRRRHRLLPTQPRKYLVGTLPA